MEMNAKIENSFLVAEFEYVIRNPIAFAFLFCFRPFFMIIQVLWPKPSQSLIIWTTLMYTPKQHHQWKKMHATNCSHSGPSRNLILFTVEYCIVFWSILCGKEGEIERNKFNTRIDIRKVSMLIGLQFDNHSNHYITAKAAATAVERRKEEKVNT